MQLQHPGDFPELQYLEMAIAFLHQSVYLDSVSTLSEHLHSKGVNFQMDSNITNLVLELRRLMVNELLVNGHLYDGLFEDTFEQDN